MDPEMNDDWYARYEIASAKQRAANLALGAARTATTMAEVQLELATQELQEIFRERVDLREGLKNE